MKIISPRALQIAAALVAVAGISTMAHASQFTDATDPNLVTNGDFAVGLSGWNSRAAGGNVTSASGHAVLTVSEVNTDVSWVVADSCVAGIVPGGSYEVAVDILIPAAQKRHGHGAGYVAFFSQPNCTGGHLGAISGQWPGDDGLWHTRASTIVAPPGAQSARVGVEATRYAHPWGGANGDPYEVWFDNASLIRLGTQTARTTFPPQ